MTLINHATNEIIFKVVYYGPALSGKTTNMKSLYAMVETARKGKIRSLLAGTDKTLFFNIFPAKDEKIEEFSFRFQLYTVPGQVRNTSVWKMALRDADSIVFVADSQRLMRDLNMESFYNMRSNLQTDDTATRDIPIVLQFNKRDLNDILTTSELNKDLNKKGYPYYEAVAKQGISVKETFQAVATALTDNARREHQRNLVGENTHYDLKSESTSVSKSGKKKEVSGIGTEHVILRSAVIDDPLARVSGMSIPRARSDITPVSERIVPDVKAPEVSIHRGYKSLRSQRIVAIGDSGPSWWIVRKLRLFNKVAKDVRFWLYFWILIGALFFGIFVTYLSEMNIDTFDEFMEIDRNLTTDSKK